MPKILHVSEILLGGTASYLSEIIPAQIAAYGADNVRILAPEDQHIHLPSLPREALLPCPPVTRSPSSLLSFWRASRRAIVEQRPGILHLHNSFAGGVLRLPYLLARRRPRIVYCAHGWSFCMDVPEAKKRRYAMVERWLAPATDRIISISQSEHEEALRLGLPADKLRMVYNGIATTAPFAKDLAAPVPDRLNLLFLGRHGPQKGYDLLLEAMRSLAAEPVHLHVAGGDLRAAAVRVDLANVTQHGWLPREDAARLMASCDALIVPSRWEGFGLVAAEAMRMGLPVLASDAGALPELVADGVTGTIFPKGDVAAIVRAIRSFDRGNIGPLGEAGRARFLQLFTADRMNRELTALYAELV